MGLLLAVAVVVGAAFLLGRRLAPHSVPLPSAIPPTEVAAAAHRAADAPASTEPAPAVAVAPPGPILAPPAVTNGPTAEERQAAIDAETDRLQDWSMSDDPASLSNILADLASPEREIRQAAIEATKQFGTTNAIPALKSAADNTDDAGEKQACLDAIEFLSLPSIDASATNAAETPE